MTKFNVGDQVKAVKGSQKGNIGTVKKVIALPLIETEYQVGFSTKPHGMTLPQSSLQIPTTFRRRCKRKSVG